MRLSSCHRGHRVVVMPSASRCRFLIAIASVTLITLYSCHLRHTAFFVTSTPIFLGHCIAIILSSIKRAYGALVPSCNLLSCLHCETTAARPSWLCHHRNSSYVMRLSSWRRRKATAFVEFSWYSHRRAIVVIHSWSSQCPPTVVLPSSSLHRHYALAVIPLWSCRHRHVDI